MSTTTRQARCPYCKTLRPSDSEGLAFFEARGPGTQDDNCRECGYAKIAHDPPPGHSVRPGKGPFVCDDFTPRTEGYEFDSYYCGCRGWD